LSSGLVLTSRGLRDQPADPADHLHRSLINGSKSWLSGDTAGTSAFVSLNFAVKK
jgi:hypothetical protein